MKKSQRGSAQHFFAGVLAANSVWHLASAAAGKEHMTPIAGSRSGPTVNALWGGLNLAGGLLLVRRGAAPTRQWGPELHSFGTGTAVFAAWMMLSERLWDPTQTDQP